LLLVSDEKPDLILLDVMMPELDGPSTLRALRDSPRGRDVPVIFMTAKAQPREVESYLALGARGVVVKPFDPMNLPDQVRAILAASPQDDPRADVGSPA
jgi:CheY-like chemotaxis protein